MKIQRILIIAFVFILAFGSISAYAMTTNFTLIAGGASSVSTSETKHVNKGKLYYHPNRLNPNNSSQWPSGVQINFRGRTNSNDYATYLSTVTGAGDYNCTYFSNSGYIGNKYKIASNLPSNGKCQKAYLSVYWVA